MKDSKRFLLIENIDDFKKMSFEDFKNNKIAKKLLLEKRYKFSNFDFSKITERDNNKHYNNLLLGHTIKDYLDNINKYFSDLDLLSDDFFSSNENWNEYISTSIFWIVVSIIYNICSYFQKDADIKCIIESSCYDIIYFIYFYDDNWNYVKKEKCGNLYHIENRFINNESINIINTYYLHEYYLWYIPFNQNINDNWNWMKLIEQMSKEEFIQYLKDFVKSDDLGDEYNKVDINLLFNLIKNNTKFVIEKSYKESFLYEIYNIISTWDLVNNKWLIVDVEDSNYWKFVSTEKVISNLINNNSYAIPISLIWIFKTFDKIQTFLKTDEDIMKLIIKDEWLKFDEYNWEVKFNWIIIWNISINTQLFQFFKFLFDNRWFYKTHKEIKEYIKWKDKIEKWEDEFCRNIKNELPNKEIKDIIKPQKGWYLIP